MPSFLTNCSRDIFFLKIAYSELEIIELDFVLYQITCPSKGVLKMNEWVVEYIFSLSDEKAKVQPVLNSCSRQSVKKVCCFNCPVRQEDLGGF